jgi:hypothetical protein
MTIRREGIALKFHVPVLTAKAPTSPARMNKAFHNRDRAILPRKSPNAIDAARKAS